MPDLHAALPVIAKAYLPLYHITAPLTYLQLFLGVFGVSAVVTGLGFQNKAGWFFLLLGIYLLAGIWMVPWMHGSGFFM